MERRKSSYFILIFMINLILFSFVQAISVPSAYSSISATATVEFINIDGSTVQATDTITLVVSSYSEFRITGDNVVSIAKGSSTAIFNNIYNLGNTGSEYNSIWFRLQEGTYDDDSGTFTPSVGYKELSTYLTGFGTVAATNALSSPYVSTGSSTIWTVSFTTPEGEGGVSLRTTPTLQSNLPEGVNYIRIISAIHDGDSNYYGKDGQKYNTFDDLVAAKQFTSTVIHIVENESIAAYEAFYDNMTDLNSITQIQNGTQINYALGFFATVATGGGAGTATNTDLSYIFTLPTELRDINMLKVLYTDTLNGTPSETVVYDKDGGSLGTPPDGLSVVYDPSTGKTTITGGSSFTVPAVTSDGDPNSIYYLPFVLSYDLTPSSSTTKTVAPGSPTKFTFTDNTVGSVATGLTGNNPNPISLKINSQSIAATLKISKNIDNMTATNSIVDTDWGWVDTESLIYPGTILHYRVTAENDGASSISNVVVEASTPANTTLIYGEDGSNLIPKYYIYDGDGNQTSSGSPTLEPVLGGTGNIRYEATAPLEAGHKIYLYFSVKVDNYTAPE